VIEKYECLCAILQALWFLVSSKIALSHESAEAILIDGRFVEEPRPRHSPLTVTEDSHLRMLDEISLGDIRRETRPRTQSSRHKRFAN